MLYLAQVLKRDREGRASLKLLAQKRAEHTWATCATEETVLLGDASDHADESPSIGHCDVTNLNEGLLVLVELSSAKKVRKVQDAKGWVLEFIEEYLSSGVSPAFLQAETQRAEQWRQSLTLKSQELGRQALEMEARRDQFQELEEKLNAKKKQLETLEAELRG